MLLCTDAIADLPVISRRRCFRNCPGVPGGQDPAAINNTRHGMHRTVNRCPEEHHPQPAGVHWLQTESSAGHSKKQQRAAVGTHGQRCGPADRGYLVRALQLTWHQRRLHYHARCLCQLFQNGKMS